MTKALSPRRPAWPAFAALWVIFAIFSPSADAAAQKGAVGATADGEDEDGRRSASDILNAVRNPNRQVSRFDRDSGLPSCAIRALVHDRDGLLWVGTSGGLVTFDGNKFRDVKPAALPSDDGAQPPIVLGVEIVYSLALDQAGHVWCGGKAGRVLRYEGPTSEPVEVCHQSGAIRLLHCASDGAMWVGGSRLARFGTDGSPTFVSESLLLRERVVEITQSPSSSVNGAVWVATNRRLLRWTEESGLVEVDEGRRRGLFFDGAGRRWELLEGNQVLVDGELKLELEGEPREITEILRVDDSTTVVAFSTQLAVAISDHEGTRIVPTDINGHLTAMHPAPNGGVWLAVSTDSLQLLEPCRYTVLRIPRRKDAALFVGSPDGATLFAGTFLAPEVWRFPPDAVLSESFGRSFPDPVEPEWAFPMGAEEARGPTAVIADSTGQLFVGSFNGLLAQSGSTLKPVPDGPQTPVRRLVSGGGETIWAAHTDTIAEYKNGTFVKREWPAASAKWRGMFYADGKLFGGIKNELVEIDVSTLQVTRRVISHRAVINGLCMCEAGDLWVTTYGEGLYCVRPNGEIDHFGLEEGLPYSYLLWAGRVPGPTENSHIWLNSNGGTIVVSLAGLRKGVSDEERGRSFRLIRTPEARGNRGQALASGELVLPTSAGLIVLDSYAEFAEQSPPQLSMQAILINDVPWEPGTEFEGTVDLEFQINAVLFPSAQSAFVEFRLKGHEVDWYQAGAARRVGYQGLGHGEYQFEVRARAPGGSYGEVLQNPMIVVHKLWHERLDTRIAAALAAVLLLIGAVRKRSRILLKRTQEMQRELGRELAITELRSRLADAEESERARIARELHDDFSQRLAAHGMALSGVAQQELPTGETQKELGVLQEDIAALSKDLHDLSRRLHPTVLDDLGLIRALRSEVTRRSSISNTTVYFNVADDLTEESLRLDKKSAFSLFRAAQQALQNAIKHGAPDMITMHLYRSGSEIRLEITDDGAGFVPAEVKGAGIGIASMQERMALVDGRLEIQSEPGKGTTITAIANCQSSERVAH